MIDFITVVEFNIGDGVVFCAVNAVDFVAVAIAQINCDPGE